MENYDLKRKWKNAQYNNELICEDCGNPVELRVGDVKIPHFAHRRGFLDHDCYYETTKESEEHRKAKSLLYCYFKEKYPDASVQTTKKQPNGRRSDIYIEHGSLKLAVEFQRQGLRVADWDIRHQEYEKLGITDLWFLSSRIYEERVSDFDFMTQVLLHESEDNIAKFLDVEKESIRFLKQINFADKEGILKQREFFSLSYNLSDLTISLDGRIESDFEQRYDIQKELFVKKCKELEAAESLNRERNIAEDLIRQSQRERFEEQAPVKSYDASNYGNGLTVAEQQLEEELAKKSSRSSEFREHDIIQGWFNEYNKIIEESDKFTDNALFTRLKLWCERTFQGYRNNNYIALQNAERLDLKLKLLNDLISGD
jgi:competence CoiA-like predicted nuclease